jgi:hypothetical protein
MCCDMCGACGPHLVLWSLSVRVAGEGEQRGLADVGDHCGLGQRGVGPDDFVTPVGCVCF